MWLILVEAGVAFFLLVFIVWWTMFQGPQPKYDEMHDDVEAQAREAQKKTEQR
jgi:cytoskeletal protein RodZ